MAGRRVWVVLAVLGVLLAACDVQASIRSDGGNSGHNAADTTLTTGSMAGMSTRFTASLGNVGATHVNVPLTAVVLNDTVFVPAPGQLRAFTATGPNACSAVCAPTWIGDFGHPWFSFVGAEVSGGSVFVMAADLDVLGQLYAFDTNGVTNCSGSPAVCQPLWTANILALDAPTVADGRVYAFDMLTYEIKVYDAAGQQGCAGSPKVCQPLWTVPLGEVELPLQRIAVVDGTAYIQDRRGTVMASDAAGVVGCSGSPSVCQPRWSAPTPGYGTLLPSPTVVAEGKVFVRRPSAGSGSELAVFDAAGVTGCSGTPTICAPLWSTPVSTLTPGIAALAVANGKVYVPNALGHTVQVYATSGAGCTGSGPMTCPPLFSFGVDRTVTIDNGLAVQSGAAGGISAYDANGVLGCSASVCAPIATAPGDATSTLTIHDGKFFGVSIDATGAARLTGIW